MLFRENVCIATVSSLTDTFLYMVITVFWGRQWHPTPALLSGKIPWMEEPGGLQSMGSLRVGHD